MNQVYLIQREFDKRNIEITPLTPLKGRMTSVVVSSLEIPNIFGQVGWVI
jgi:hypothetical protein